MSNQENHTNCQHTITYESLLEGNKAFVERALNENPNFFKNLSDKQSPPVLWIGCSDSRVPANQITNTQPGDIFVHRNIANVVVNTDMNILSVMDYAINVLEVKHVIVCGHYGCGGVRAAMGNQQFGLIDNWLSNIKDVYRLHQYELELIPNMDKRADRLVELNVIESVRNVIKTSIVQNRWAAGKDLKVHGWAYSLKSGLITDLDVSAESNQCLPSVFKLLSDSKA